MKRDICGIMIDDLDKRKLFSEIVHRIDEKKRTVIFTPNPIMAQNAKKDKTFMEILNGSDYNVPDGNGIILASRLLKTPIPERICGIELAEALLGEAERRGLKVFLYGGKEGVAALAATRLCEKHPRLKICGVANGYTCSTPAAVEKIKGSGADILYVCLGSPKQERWISENADALSGVKLFMGLGGSLDVWSGEVRRAPAAFRKSGFEWLWRMTSSPKKLKDFPKLISFGLSTVAKRVRDIGIMHR